MCSRMSISDLEYKRSKIIDELRETDSQDLRHKILKIRLYKVEQAGGRDVYFPEKNQRFDYNNYWEYISAKLGIVLGLPKLSRAYPTPGIRSMISSINFTS